MSWNDLRKGRYSCRNTEYFITFNTHNRLPIFKDFGIACLFCQQIAINEIKHNCIWLSWVLMPDHFHGLLQLGNNETLLKNIVGQLKGTSAFLINKRLNKQGKLWQSTFYDHALRQEEDRTKIARYIVANPLRKGLVKNIRDYPYWNSTYL
jgi:REP element-mobilizing transposase RayT